MGFFSSLSQMLGIGKRQVSVIVVGLDNSGKYRNLWETYYAGSQAILFVVDSSDRLRMAVARDELWMIIDHSDVRGKTMADGSSLIKNETNVWPTNVFPLWYTSPDIISDKQSMLQPSPFDSIAPQGFYPGSRWPPMGPDGGYAEPPKWVDPTMYPIAFANQGHESYPSDPFPSTSVAGPVDYKMNPMPYYPNPIAHVGYNPQDYQQAFSQWKMSPMKLPKPSSSNPPYRTGPGTNS
uniref:ADP-ribosylation factor-like protein 6 n=1 Tax=Heterorhabditis bacteriophora TaxID=37862 RepID=A0A1I7WC22_HETBA